MPHQLYEIHYEARPLPAHQSYWSFGGGLLVTWTMAQSAEDAAARSEQMLRLLLWELKEPLPTQAVIVRDPLPPEGYESAERFLVQQARDSGFAYRAMVWPPGGDGDLPSEAPPVG